MTLKSHHDRFTDMKSNTAPTAPDFDTLVEDAIAAAERTWKANARRVNDRRFRAAVAAGQVLRPLHESTRDALDAGLRIVDRAVRPFHD